MGSVKALLEFEGRTFLERILDAVRESCIGHVVVVAGHHFDRIAEAYPAMPLVFNPRYEHGMSTSVQAGLRALPPGAVGAGVFLVDHPLIDAATIDALAGELRPGRIVLPVHGGRRGHPAFFPRDLFAEILALGPGEGLNTVVRRDPGRVFEAPAGEGVLREIDTPVQSEKLLGEGR
jgi:molybdenum cofactor cytidylyltransferase